MRDLLKLLALTADEIVVGLFLLLVLPSFGVDVPLWAVVAVIAVLLAKDSLIAPFILRGGLGDRPKAGPESLIGRTAVVVEDMKPDGMVKLNGELWSARCVDGTARRGEVVVIVGVSGARVLVERRASPEPGQPPQDCSS